LFWFITASLALALLGAPLPQPLPVRGPDFATDVAPLLHANCAVCHRPDGPAPFALLSYDDARGHAKEIRTAVTSRRMPPWSAVSASGYPDLLHNPGLSANMIIPVQAGTGAPMVAGPSTGVGQPASAGQEPAVLGAAPAAHNLRIRSVS